MEGVRNEGKETWSEGEAKKTKKKHENEGYRFKGRWTQQNREGERDNEKSETTTKGQNKATTILPSGYTFSSAVMTGRRVYESHWSWGLRYGARRRPPIGSKVITAAVIGHERRFVMLKPLITPHVDFSFQYLLLSFQLIPLACDGRRE